MERACPERVGRLQAPTSPFRSSTTTRDTLDERNISALEDGLLTRGAKAFSTKEEAVSERRRDNSDLGHHEKLC